MALSCRVLTGSSTKIWFSFAFCIKSYLFFLAIFWYGSPMLYEARTWYGAYMWNVFVQNKWMEMGMCWLCDAFTLCALHWIILSNSILLHSFNVFSLSHSHSLVPSHFCYVGYCHHFVDLILIFIIFLCGLMGKSSNQRSISIPNYSCSVAFCIQ